MMPNKIKGVLKGLRYITQIFETGNCKEQELQIGNPTDVKHVAHIGWDGPSQTSAPSGSKAGVKQQSGGAGVSTSSSTPDLSESTKPTRRQKNSKASGEPFTQDPNAPKKSHRKKPKGSTGGGESKLPVANSCIDDLEPVAGSQLECTDLSPTSVPKPSAQEGT
uniref:CRIB domain-containing protein n=1 Tax=Nelumbo nucifera TaxID=4432 RepID=A0A822XID2_NELNU|nr:TPA_asm: hypothetical protein HUJ06_021450 [Nelumbo nucifera]